MVTAERKLIEKTLSEKAKQLGFKKSRYSFYIHLKENYYATLNFMFANKGCKDSVFVNAMIGVLREDLSDLVTKITSYNRMAYKQFQMGRQLGYLTPENAFKEWCFKYGENHDALYDEIFENITKYASKYWEDLSDDDHFFQAVQECNGLDKLHQDYYLPLLYYIRGEKEKGLRCVEEAIVRRGTRHTDEELRGNMDKNMPIFRAGEGPHMTPEEIDKLLEERGSILIVSGDGYVDPKYLEFKEKFMQLE